MVRDIAEVYRIIPLHESQWPSVVVRIANDPERYALNTCNSFGCTTAGGLFGLFRDALTDILRAKGIGPILKWVDNFFRIPPQSIPTYNAEQSKNQWIIIENSGMLHPGGRIWYKGTTSPESGDEHFAEHLLHPLQLLPSHQNSNTSFPYDF